MKFHPYFYEAPDGIHYPDTVAGSSYFYGVDLTKFMEAEGGTLVNLDWELEKGLEGFEEVTDTENPLIHFKQIYSPYVGTYTVTCKVNYIAKGVDCLVPVRLLIKVL